MSKVINVGHRQDGKLMDGYYIKFIKTSHIINHPLGLTLDKIVYDLIRHECKAIIMINPEAEDRKAYYISIEDFDKYKTDFDRGFGKKYHISLSRWK
jgi:hypothetical protein